MTTASSSSAARHRWRLAFFVAYALMLVVALFSPGSQVQSGLVVDVTEMAARVLPPYWATYARFEVLANVVLIAPLSLLGSLTFPRAGWQAWTSWGFVGSLTVEVVQALALPHRQASFSDVVANTLGALAGSWLAVGLRTAARQFGCRNPAKRTQ